jgi:hypothetical protein
MRNKALPQNATGALTTRCAVAGDHKKTRGSERCPGDLIRSRIRLHFSGLFDALHEQLFGSRLEPNHEP